MTQSDFINFTTLRKEKQKGSDEALLQFYDAMMNDFQTFPSIREKVRARHIFQLEMNLEQQEEIERNWRNHFDHWFIFDYVNVIGTTLFQQYTKKKIVAVKEYERHMLGLLLALLFQPYEYVENLSEQEIIVQSIDSGVKKNVLLPGKDNTLFQRGELLWMRIAKSAFHCVSIGPMMTVPTSKKELILYSLQKRQQQFFRKHPKATIHSYYKASVLLHLKMLKHYK